MDDFKKKKTGPQNTNISLWSENPSQIIDIYLIETAGCPPSPREETIWKNSVSENNAYLLSVSMCLEIIHRAPGIPVW